MGIPQRALNWMEWDYRMFLEHENRGTSHWFITRDYSPDERAIRENGERIVLPDLFGTNANGVGICGHEACIRRRGSLMGDMDYRGKNQRLIKSMSLNRCCLMFLYYQANLDQGSMRQFEDATTYVQLMNRKGQQFQLLDDVVFNYRFRLYDDDDNLYYEGWQTEQDFEPLDEFATPNAGAAYMKTSDKGGEFIHL